jgi:hypothetical protein
MARAGTAPHQIAGGAGITPLCHLLSLRIPHAAGKITFSDLRYLYGDAGDEGPILSTVAIDRMTGGAIGETVQENLVIPLGSAADFHLWLAGPTDRTLRSPAWGLKH